MGFASCRREVRSPSLAREDMLRKARISFPGVIKASKSILTYTTRWARSEHSSTHFFAFRKCSSDGGAQTAFSFNGDVYSRCSIQVLAHSSLSYMHSRGLAMIFLSRLHSIPSSLWDHVRPQCKDVGLAVLVFSVNDLQRHVQLSQKVAARNATDGLHLDHISSPFLLSCLAVRVRLHPHQLDDFRTTNFY